MAEARERHAERSGLESRRREQSKALDRALAGETLAILKARLDESKAQVDTSASEHGEGEPPAGEGLEAAFDAAREAVQQASGVAEDRRSELEALERRLVGLKERAAAAETQAREATEDAAALSRQLETARVEATDEILSTRAHEADERLQRAQGEHVAAQEAFDALDPDTVEQANKSAQARCSRLEKEQADTTTLCTRMRGTSELTVAAERGSRSVSRPPWPPPPVQVGA